MSVEGAVISTRDDVNMNFYGRAVSAKDLLLQDSPNQPLAAKMLYEALDAVAGTSGKVVEASHQGASVGELRSSAQLVESVSEERPQVDVSSRSQMSYPESTLSGTVDARSSSFRADAEHMQASRHQMLGFEAGIGLQYAEQVYSEEDEEDPLPMLPCL